MKQTKISWGEGLSDLFMEIEERGCARYPRILDVEIDGEELIYRCGGKIYYTSCSGASGAGFLKNLGPLTRVGLWRTDTVHNEHHWFLPVGKDQYGNEITVALPYASHWDAKRQSEVLHNFPTVIKVSNKVIFCHLYGSFLEVLSLLLAGKELPESRGLAKHCHRTLRKGFSYENSFGSPYEKEVVIEFYDYFRGDNTPDPWCFARENLASYATCQWEEERMFQLLGIHELPDGSFVRTVKVAGGRYMGRIIDGNPLEAGYLTAGWEWAPDKKDIIVRFYDNDAHLVAFAKADEMYHAYAERLARRLGEGNDFIVFLCEGYKNRYIEYEQVVPKMLYLFDKDKVFEGLRKGLLKKVRDDMFYRARQWVDRMNDQRILEEIPDEAVVTFDDSLKAGNCRPGTEEFVGEFYPGETQTTAGELKKHAGNPNVMRVLKYVASRMGIVQQQPITLPEDDEE